MNSCGWTRLGIAVCLTACAASAATAPRYDSGLAAWNAGNYPRAIDDLLAFRRQPYGRRPDVDYMLGTSGCRVSGRIGWGREVLDWMLYGYALTYKSRVQVVAERDRCNELIRDSVSGNELAGIVEERAAGMTGQGKTFYWASRHDQPVASYPIRRLREMDREVFAGRLVALGDEGAARSLAEELAPGHPALPGGRFLLISEAGHSERDLLMIGQTLNRFVGFLSDRFEIFPPEHYLRVHLVESHYQVQEAADRIHGLDVSRATVGYTFVDDASVVAAVPGQAAGTVLHELFHLLVRARFGDIPQWLDEGIASLYEVSGRRGDHYFGLPNWRGQVLEELWSVRPDVGTLVRTEWFLFDDPRQAESMAADGRPPELFFDEEEGRRQAAMMAAARYFVMYLEQRGELAPLFAAMRDSGFPSQEEADGVIAARDARDRAVGILEATLDRSVATLDREFVEWLQSGAAGRPGDGLQPVAFGGPVRVATADVNVRTGPGTDYQRLTLLREGSQAAVFAESGGWYELRLPDGTVAFVAAEFLGPPRP